MPYLVLLVGLMIGAQLAIADQLKEFEFDGPSVLEQKTSRAVCSFGDVNFPEDLIVYAAGEYAGRLTGFQIDQSGHEATQFDIAVNRRERPVALILGAYEPTIWNLGWTSGTNIVAVLVSGYHRQVVAGLPEDVPVLISTYDNQGPCGHFRISATRDPSLNPRSRRLFGQPVSLVYPGDRKGKIIVGDPIAPGSRMVTSAATSPESYRNSAAPLAGSAGLEDAVKKGFIRPATLEDADAWIAARATASEQQDIPPVAGAGVPMPSRPRLFRAFVVLQEFTYPAGLYGANSAVFFIPEGVPRPNGDRGHSTVYDFNLMVCQGASCQNR